MRTFKFEEDLLRGSFKILPKEWFEFILIHLRTALSEMGLISFSFVNEITQSSF